MRAIVAHAAKDIRIEETPSPALGPQDVRVRVAFGGICGSDLHYFNHGGFGAVRLKEPMILGHEISGVVEAVGARSAANQGRRPRRGQSERALQSLPLLPGGAAESVPRHAVLRQRDALPACPGRLPRDDRLPRIASARRA